MRLFPIALLALSGCVTVHQGTAACPESKTVCFGNQPECDLDRTRGCMLCACRSPYDTSPPRSPAAARALPEDTQSGPSLPPQP